MKKLLNEKGITLIELLAVITLTALVSVTLFSILINFINTEKKVSADVLLRDEADYYMANLINTIYTLKESDLCGGLKTSPKADEPYYYIETKDSNGSCTNPTKTGFVNESNNLSLYINGDKINQQNEKISIDQSSKIEKNQNVYKITLTLQYSGKTKSYFTEIHSINDN